MPYYAVHRSKPDDELTHWKYIKRIKKNGKWKYYYDKEAAEKDSKKKTKNPLKKLSNSFDKAVAKGEKFLYEKLLKNKTSDKKPTTVKIAETVRKGKAKVNKLLNKQGATLDYKYKYIAKVKLPNGKYRYFYDQDEYDTYLKRQEYQKNEPDFMKDVPDIDSNVIMNADENMAEINEEYDYFNDARSMNCAYCTTAYEMRMRGYDVQAADYDDATYDADLWGMYSWYENGKMVYVSDTGNSTDISKYVKTKSESNGNEIMDTMNIYNDYTVNYSGSTIQKALEQGNPPNSRGNLCVYWSGGGGHSMAYETDSKGKVTIRDCQTNETYTPQQLADYGVCDVVYMRTDNLEFSENVLHTVEEN